MTLLGLILISFLTIFYTKSTRKTIKDNELIEIEGELLSKPRKSSTGGDMPNYFIHIKLKNTDKDFYLENCGYDMVDKSYVLGLESDKKVFLKVNRNNYLYNRKLDIYSLTTIDNLKVLDLYDYNLCYINYWRYLIPISLLLILIIAYRFIRFIMRYDQHG